MDGRDKTICIVSSTRADWGLLQPLAARLKASPGICLRIVATNMHLLPEYGMTVNEIRQAGFTVDRCVAMRGDSPVYGMAECLHGMADAFEDLQPDAVLLLGDRYEMLAVASAAAVMRLPIIHIAGGEISEGAIDDSIRHAITKLSTLHLTATEPYRRRVIQLGEQPDRVINTGAIGVWNAFNTPILTKEEFEADLGVDLSKPLFVITYHPATLDDKDPVESLQALFEALDKYPEATDLITFPNNDARGEIIIEEIKCYAAAHPQRVKLVKSLGMRRYHSAIHYASLVIGNSSSGIVEAPSAGTPTVDIGIRQRGRIAAPSVIHCGDSAAEIQAAMAKGLSSECQELAARKENPYYKENTLDIMCDSILKFIDTLPAEPKKFYDL